MTATDNEQVLRRILDDLAEIVAVPSVYSTPTEGAPYGKPCLDALEWFVAKASAYGLKTELIDGRCAYAEVGEGAECVGILGHLDVVPAGNGWASDPFTMLEENGKVYGRGVGDDKGAVVVCLHALKAIKESGRKLPRRVRLIVGADEERGSSCMEHYVKSGNEIPVMSFVPDSEFPVINSEKGIAHIKFIFDEPAIADSVGYIDGAACYNAVPDRATVKPIKDGPLYKKMCELSGGLPTSAVFKYPPFVERAAKAGAALADFSVSNDRAGCTIAAEGTAEHASTPLKGDNALWKILRFIAGFNDAVGSKYIENICEYLCAPDAAKRLGIYVDDPKSGDTTMCMSQAWMENGKLVLLIDFRLPLGIDAAFVADKIAQKLGCATEITDYRENLYVDEDTPLVKTLLSVYRKLTGDNTPPLKVGGGTYARELPNAVAFGCTPVDLEINMHRADENFPVVQLYKNFEIYLAAAVALAEL